MAVETPTSSRRSGSKSWATRLGAVAFLALAAGAIAAPVASAGPATYDGSSADGKTVFFSTNQKLVPGDTDNRTDVYARLFDNSLGYITREISTGPTGGNDAYDATYDGASTDGTKVFFSTAESLVPGDTDHAVDIYMRDLTNGTTTLVSQGSSACAPTCGNGNFDAFFNGATPDGSKVFFTTGEQLSPQDTNSSPDIYVRDLTTGTTTLVSQGDSSCAPCGNGPQPVIFRGASSDGTKVFFTSTQQFASADTDSSLGSVDIYQRDLTAGTTTLVSPTGTCPSGNDCNAVYSGASSDGSHVFFETNEQLSTDTDAASDVYDWSNGTATLLSTGPNGDNNGPQPATFAGASADGSTVFFQTSESLIPGDTDGAQDIYMRSGGVTTLVSTGPVGDSASVPAFFDAVSTDGTKVFFSTAESLVSADTDQSSDVYLRDLTSGTTTLVSTGPAGGNGPFDATFAGATSDGSHVFFKTAEPLVSQDTDTSPDIYEWSGGTTSLVSAGPLGDSTGFGANLRGFSQDGSHAFFETDERLTVDDLDTALDVYDYSAGGTLLVSVGNSILLGPSVPSLTATNPVSPNGSTSPAVIGQADPNTSVKIYASVDCSGAPVAEGTSQQLGGSGIPVAVAVGSTTTFRATATDVNGDTSACSTQVVTYQQTSGGGGGGGGGGGNGTPPSAPKLTGTDPAGPANTSQPRVKGSAPTGATVQVYASRDCSGVPLASGTAVELASPGIQVSVPMNTTTSIRATATVAGVTSSCSAPITYVEDSIPPQTRITYGPGVKTRFRNPIFRFIAIDALGTTFTCKVDRHPWRPCSAPLRLRRMRRGKHTFQVKAADAAGNAELKPVKRSFKVVSG